MLVFVEPKTGKDYRCTHESSLGLVLTCKLSVRDRTYTEEAGLPFFNRVTVSTNGNWCYVSALDSMREKLCFRCRSINIGPSYTQ